MRCPFCKRDNDRVIDTRAMEDGFMIRRRRSCGSCHRRFTTYERLEELSLRVVKRDESRQPFDREKIRRGIERACWKRPVSTERIELVVEEIESEVLLRNSQEILCQEIGEITLRRLRPIDEVAYVRFASVYRDFANVQDFFRAIESIHG
ncbi:Transcriptional repressor NrdR [Roseimaritima multifibrata]|uniref:Transcriptional repressor NrdR n=1 Tax=Roseimaritima multifibrata TaxID=1930274 RepID=A0A517MDS8_9BACT|nr:transcriptional regulator NrdR [Roseimaritima multifibrata]QDS92937.1 Transcriptional repressor NrdR [Roseimaritima multifibrata]